jgi:hypothetical protein
MKIIATEQDFILVNKTLENISRQPAGIEFQLAVTFEIEVEEHCVTDISVESAKYIHKELGKRLSVQEGGES